MAKDLSQNKRNSFAEKSNLTAGYLTGDYSSSQGSLIWKRKTAWLFLLLGAGVIFLSGWYFKYQVLQAPLDNELPPEIAAQFANSGQSQEEIIADLKSKDTDQDGLNDYQEVYQFHTSMFLPDTDSDGFSDYQEANSGNDPLCPTGEDCNILRLITPNTKLAEVVEDVALDPNLTLQQATLNQLRSFLVENGLPQAEIDALTDEELIIIVSAWAEENQSSEEVDFAELSPEEVRTFLLNQPEADKEAINRLSEQELIDIRNRLAS